MRKQKPKALLLTIPVGFWAGKHWPKLYWHIFPLAHRSILIRPRRTVN